jgi:hypothetical protein
MTRGIITNGSCCGSITERGRSWKSCPRTAIHPEVTLIVGVPSTDPLAPPTAPKVFAENTRYRRAVLQHAMSGWQGGVKWLNTQVQRSDERCEVGRRKGHREIVLLAVNRLSTVLLSIRAGQPLAPHRP